MAAEPDDTLRAGQFGPTVYAAWRNSTLGEITEALEHRLLLRLAGPLANHLVLDVGCGDGTLARIFADQGAARVTGCDADWRMIAKARASAYAIDLCVADTRDLPFGDGTFDVVTCVTVLTFVSDASNAVREMVRVLRPGGRLVIGDLGKWNFWAARRRVRGWLGAPMWRAARFHTGRGIAALTEEAGLRDQAIKGAIFFPPLTSLARMMAPLDPCLGEITTMGAAFVAVQATKP